MDTGKVIERIGIDRLLEHPGNPNRMSKVNYKKLAGHIKSSGDYEPVVVRRHPEKDGFYEILNGHHRTKVLGDIGYESIDCVVWDVNDERALMLLATLNRLSGKDDVIKRAKLIEELNKQFDMKELAASLPDTKEAIKKLNTISISPPVLQNANYDIPETLVYMVSSEQKAFADKVIKEAMDPGKEASDFERRAWALIEILRDAKMRKV